MIFNTMTIWCDHFTDYAPDHRRRCSQGITLETGSQAVARMQAVEQGWTIVRDPYAAQHEYCPNHKPQDEQ